MTPLTSVILGSLLVYFTHAERHGVQVVCFQSNYFNITVRKLQFIKARYVYLSKSDKLIYIPHTFNRNIKMETLGRILWVEEKDTRSKTWAYMGIFNIFLYILSGLEIK